MHGIPSTQWFSDNLMNFSESIARSMGHQHHHVIVIFISSEMRYNYMEACLLSISSPPLIGSLIDFQLWICKLSSLVNYDQETAWALSHDDPVTAQANNVHVGRWKTAELDIASLRLPHFKSAINAVFTSLRPSMMPHQNGNRHAPCRMHTNSFIYLDHLIIIGPDRVRRVSSHCQTFLSLSESMHQWVLERYHWSIWGHHTKPLSSSSSSCARLIGQQILKCIFPSSKSNHIFPVDLPSKEETYSHPWMCHTHLPFEGQWAFTISP